MSIFKNFSGSMPPAPLESFLLLSLNCLKLTLPERNYAWKSDEIWCSFPEKNSDYAPDMKHFAMAYLRSFPSLNVFAYS